MAPKKGKTTGGKKTTAKASVPLRRSPRKHVQSAKSKDAEEAVSTSRDVKKASPAKKSRTGMIAALTKQSKRGSNSEAADHEASKKANTASSTGETPVTATPKKRGRPKKVTSPAVETPKVAEVDHTISMAPDSEEAWTDSPKKKTANKPAFKVAKNGASSPKLLPKIFDITSDSKARQGGVGGIKKSIEAPSGMKETRATGRSKSPFRRPSQSPVRSTSRNSPKSPSSVVKKFIAARTPSVGCRTAGRARSWSPPKSSTKEPAVAESPSSSKESTARGRRRRFMSPVKAATAFSVEPGNKSSTSRRRSSRTPSLRLSPDPILIPKTRKTRSPENSPPRSPTRSRQASPTKSPTRSRQASPTKLPEEHQTNGQTGRASRSPERSTSQRSARASSSSFVRPSTASTFRDRFIGNDEYGKALRRIESQAYRATKRGRAVSGALGVPGVGMGDTELAHQRGIERADLELALNSISGKNTQRSQKSTDGAILLPWKQSGPSSSKTSSTAHLHPRVEEVEDEDEYNVLKRRRPSPVRPLFSPPKQSISASTGKKKASSTSPELQESLEAYDVDARHPPFLSSEPSAPNHGSVRSPTNPIYIQGTTRKNPFFETMPSPEVWHRNMPGYFPFAETPFMQQIMSRQMTEDLARGEAERNDEKNSSGNLFGRASTAIKSGLSAVGQSIWGGPSREPPSSPPWKLPEVSESEVEEARRDIEGTHETDATAAAVQKRKLSDSNGPAKRVRRRFPSPGYEMSGAL